MSTTTLSAVQTSITPAPRWPWVMLFSRLVLFFMFQAIFAAVFYLAGRTSPWEASAAWWPVTVGIANLVCIFLLVRLYRGEGTSYWNIFKIEKATWKTDLLIFLAIFLIGGPIAFFPNTLLSQAIYGEAQAGNTILLQPLPVWAVWLSILLFPVTQGLAELPTYFAYVMPRLKSQTGSRLLAIGLPSLMLGFQHVMAPLYLDAQYVTWRLLMFVPFAFFVGILLYWRPRLLPFAVVIHILMDLATVTILFSI